jgi:hypothetical protein
MTVWACIMILFPAVDAGLAEKLVLTGIAFDRDTILSNYLVANAAQYQVLDIFYFFLIHNARI